MNPIRRPRLGFRPARLVASLLLALLPCFAPVTHAYVLEGPRWPSNQPIPMTLGLGDPGRALSDGTTDWNTAAQAALTVWNQYLGSGVRFTASASPNALVGAQNDKTNTVYFASTVYGKSFGTDTLAVTTYFFSGNTLQEADVAFNNAKNFDSYRGPLKYDTRGVSIPDLKRVAIHEFGHALGLDHPDQAGQKVTAIMNSRVSDVEMPQSDDLAGLQAIYGAPSSGSSGHPAFFSGETPLGNGAYFLQLAASGNAFGYYSYLSDQRFIYHFDLGYEYLVDAGDGKSGLYFYDFASGSWFYTSPSYPFPYLYDFSLNALLYYYPVNGDPQHYTKAPRYFYNFKTGQVITK